MKNVMTTCRACGAELAKNAKACPHCGAKNKKPIYKKWWFWLLIIIVVGVAFGGSGEEISPRPAGEGKESAGAEKKEIVYAHYDVTELFDALDGNALKAEKTFQGQYVELEGYVSNIDSDGSYISIGAAPDNYNYFLDSVQCYIKTEEQLNQVMEVSVEDPIVIRGKIKSIGEVMGYTLDIDTIN